MRRHDLWVRDNRICHLCLDEVPLREASRDHLVPQSVYRDHSPSNLALAHAACNSFRSSHPVDRYSVDEYRAARARILRSSSVPKIPKRQPLVPQRGWPLDAWFCSGCGAINDSPYVQPKSVAYRECAQCHQRRYNGVL